MCKVKQEKKNIYIDYRLQYSLMPLDGRSRLVHPGPSYSKFTFFSHLTHVYLYCLYVNTAIIGQHMDSLDLIIIDIYCRVMLFIMWPDDVVGSTSVDCLKNLCAFCRVTQDLQVPEVIRAIQDPQ